MKRNKYIYLYVIQGYYNSYYGWEDLTESEDKKCAIDDLKAYNKNELNYPHRLIQRREKNQ